jgi:hypothetical protein
VAAFDSSVIAVTESAKRTPLYKSDKRREAPWTLNIYKKRLHYVCDWRMDCRRIILADFNLWTLRKISGNVRETSRRKPRANDSNANRVRQTRKDDCTVGRGSIRARDLLAALANYPRLDQEYYDSLSPNISRSWRTL